MRTPVGRYSATNRPSPVLQATEMSELFTPLARSILPVLYRTSHGPEIKGLDWRSDGNSKQWYGVRSALEEQSVPAGPKQNIAMRMDGGCQPVDMGA